MLRRECQQRPLDLNLLQKFFQKIICASKYLHIFAGLYLHAMEARRDVFQAIADPTRREIINLIAHQSLHVNAIADRFQITRQAVSLHVKILTECGLVTIRQQGRERYCEARLSQLKAVSHWVDQYRQFWNTQIDALDQYIHQVHSKHKKNK
jgi:DNA-binding transcriptional ArsR family regulator